MTPPELAEEPGGADGLSIRGLCCARGGVRVIEGLSTDLRPGRALVLRGPNGSGKTTLLRTLAGLQPPVDGSVSRPASDMAYASHADGVKGALSVAETLRFWAGVFGAPDIAPALDAFDLHALSDRAGQHLSAGQRRRVGLARLALTGRAVWLLDEPTVSLDAHGTAQFASLVRAHLGQGGMALIATHIDLGLQADTLDIARYKARPPEIEDWT